MKLGHIILAAAIGLTPLAGYAASKLSDFPLADRIKAKVESGKPLDIYVSYHDVSNEFAPFIKAGVQKAAADDKVNAQFIGPTGPNADAQISEIETLMGKMDGLAISSVSSDALAPVIDRVLKAGIPVVTFNTDNPNSKRLAFAGQDLVQSGREAGKLMGKVLDGKGKVHDHHDRRGRAMVARPGEGRARGVERVRPASRWSIRSTPAPIRRKSIPRSRTPCSPTRASPALLSLECCSTPAAGTWVERNKATDKVKVVGFDLLDQTVQLVQTRRHSGDHRPGAGEAGLRGGRSARQILERASRSTTSTPGVKVYTKDNIAEVAKK